MIDIRQATASDLPQLADLWREFMDYHAERDPFFTPAPDGREQWLDFVGGKLSDDSWQVVVAEEAGRLVGYCSVSILEHPPIIVDRRYAFVQDLIVTERHRRQGIGTRLFEFARDWAHAQGVARVELNVSVVNEAARGFWRGLGFAVEVERMALNP
jgi:ribosomal protein S18 acetylase RimI-like enzyme